MTGQSRRMSVLETCTNTFLGYGIALWAQVTIFPWFDVNVSLTASAGIACIMLVISLVRQYAFRRFFNWLQAGQELEAHTDHASHEALARLLQG